MHAEPGELDLLAEALQAMRAADAAARSCRDDVDRRPLPAAARPLLLDVARRLGRAAPFGHPLYLGHMLKPPHPVARLAYALALWPNPNNHAFDGGPASSAMEIEAVERIAHLFGWTGALGHLCSGGTVANLEALWVAREARRGRPAGIAASAQAHYCHARAAALLGLPFHRVGVDSRGRMDPDALAAVLRRGGVGTVVATLGTPAAGAVDPLDEIAAVCAEHGVRLHADAAYGGYFRLACNLTDEVAAALAALGLADSIVVDPHKHGLQPYGCGCLLLRDATLRRVYAHDPDYAYLASDEPHLGAISLECSRPGAAAVALWTTLQLLPLDPAGEFAGGLEASREAALRLWTALGRDERFTARFAPLFPPDLDVVVWAVRAPSAQAASAGARALQQAAQAAGLHLSMARLPRAMVEPWQVVPRWDADDLVVLRACLMKPLHLDWMPRILDVLHRATDTGRGPVTRAAAEPAPARA